MPTRYVTAGRTEKTAVPLLGTLVFLGRWSDLKRSKCEVASNGSDRQIAPRDGIGYALRGQETETASGCPCPLRKKDLQRYKDGKRAKVVCQLGKWAGSFITPESARGGRARLLSSEKVPGSLTDRPRGNDRHRILAYPADPTAGHRPTRDVRRQCSARQPARFHPCGGLTITLPLRIH